MRLAVVTTRLAARGGAARVILKIAQHFDADVHCSIFEPENTFPEFQDLNIIPRKKNPHFKSGLEERLFGATDLLHFHNLKLEGYDVINAHLPPTELVRNRNSPAIWYSYGLPNPGPGKPSGALQLAKRVPLRASMGLFSHLQKRAVHDFEHIFAVSRNTADTLKSRLGCQAEPLYPGVDAERFGCRNYERFFFYPSRICPQKNFEFAIDAFRQFSSKMRGWKLVIAGSLEKGHERYARRLQSLGGGQVEIETDISDERLLDLYSRCYATLFAPRDEALGLIPLEGMASSKPSIARNDCGMRETVSDGVDGFLVNNPQEMADKMEWLVSNPDACERMGKSGREKVLKQFTWDSFLSRFGERAEELSE